MSRLWILVGAGIGFVAGFGASMFLHQKPVTQAATQHAAHHASQGQAAGEQQQHDHMKIVSLPAGSDAPAMDFHLVKDPIEGWNLHIETRNFRFAPENVNSPNQSREGHAHVYINGEKFARVYAPWFHIAALPVKVGYITVTLNTNDHSTLAVGDNSLTLTKELSPFLQ